MNSKMPKLLQDGVIILPSSKHYVLNEADYYKSSHQASNLTVKQIDSNTSSSYGFGSSLSSSKNSYDFSNSQRAAEAMKQRRSSSKTRDNSSFILLPPSPHSHSHHYNYQYNGEHNASGSRSKKHSKKSSTPTITVGETISSTKKIFSSDSHSHAINCPKFLSSIQQSLAGTFYDSQSRSGKQHFVAQSNQEASKRNRHAHSKTAFEELDILINTTSKNNNSNNNNNNNIHRFKSSDQLKSSKQTTPKQTVKKSGDNQSKSGDLLNELATSSSATQQLPVLIPLPMPQFEMPPPPPQLLSHVNNKKLGYSPDVPLLTMSFNDSVNETNETGKLARTRAADMMSSDDDPSNGREKNDSNKDVPNMLKPPRGQLKSNSSYNLFAKPSRSTNEKAHLYENSEPIPDSFYSKSYAAENKAAEDCVKQSVQTQTDKNYSQHVSKEEAADKDKYSKFVCDLSTSLNAYESGIYKSANIANQNISLPVNKFFCKILLM